MINDKIATCTTALRSPFKSARRALEVAFIVLGVATAWAVTVVAATQGHAILSAVISPVALFLSVFAVIDIRRTWGRPDIANTTVADQKREVYAKAAMSSMVSGRFEFPVYGSLDDIKDVAQASVLLADALIDELEKTGGENENT